MSHPQSIADIQKRLNDLSAEMITLIQKYGLDAAHPLDVIDTARRKISDQADYIRFLELSPEGRIPGEVADQMGQTSGSA